MSNGSTVKTCVINGSVVNFPESKNGELVITEALSRNGYNIQLLLARYSCPEGVHCNFSGLSFVAVIGRALRLTSANLEVEQEEEE